MSTVERLYSKLELPLSDASRASMQRFHAANPYAKHGKHEYTAEQYGLTDSMVREGFADYAHRFGRQEWRP